MENPAVVEPAAFTLSAIAGLPTLAPIEIKLLGTTPLPALATIGSAGYDLRASQKCVIYPQTLVRVPTGVCIKMPPNLDATIYGRSGLAMNNRIHAHYGLIDSDYVGEIIVGLTNHGDAEFTINAGDRIAQLVFRYHTHANFIQVQSLPDTTRTGGFGSTGVC